MPGCVHRMGDEFALRGYRCDTRNTLKRTAGLIPKIGHAKSILFFLYDSNYAIPDH